MKEKLIKLFRDLHSPSYRRLYYLVFRYINISKTLYLNFRVLPFRQAIKMPIWIYGKVSFVSLRGKIEIKTSHISPAMVHLGFPEDIYFNPKLSGILNIDGRLTFTGKFIASCGYNLRTYEDGHIYFGDNVKLGAQINFVSRTNISIDNYSRIAFEVVILDTGFHYVKGVDSDIIHNADGSVLIGKYNWIGNRTVINKGTQTPDNLIVASSSLLNKDYTAFIPEYSLIGGSPAKLLKTGITRIWNGNTEVVLREMFKKNKTNSIDINDLPIK